MKLSKAEVTHLRLILGWLRCSEGVFQSPEEIRATWKDLAEHGIQPSANNETRERLMQSYNLSADVPKYIRHALKMLTAHLREHDKKMEGGGTVDMERVKGIARSIEPALKRLASK